MYLINKCQTTDIGERVLVYIYLKKRLNLSEIQRTFSSYMLHLFFYCEKRSNSSLGRYVFGSEISYNKPPPPLPGLAY
jgi:hypothetical protein